MFQSVLHAESAPREGTFAKGGSVTVPICVEQGLDWYTEQLKQDADGDFADEFLEESSVQQRSAQHSKCSPLQVCLLSIVKQSCFGILEIGSVRMPLLPHRSMGPAVQLNCLRYPAVRSDVHFLGRDGRGSNEVARASLWYIPLLRTAYVFALVCKREEVHRTFGKAALHIYRHGQYCNLKRNNGNKTQAGSRHCNES